MRHLKLSKGDQIFSISIVKTPKTQMNQYIKIKLQLQQQLKFEWIWANPNHELIQYLSKKTEATEV